MLCEVSGMVDIGLGLRLPHPQNIIIGMETRLGDYCSVYHNVTVARSTFRAGVEMPRIGDRVILGAGAILIGGIDVGEDAVVGAGAVVTQSVPAATLVTSAPNAFRERKALTEVAHGEPSAFATPHPLVRRPDS